MASRGTVIALRSDLACQVSERANPGINSTVADGGDRRHDLPDLDAPAAGANQSTFGEHFEEWVIAEHLHSLTRLALIGKYSLNGRINMAEIKTTANDASVDEFLAAVDNDQRRTDAQELCTLMQAITGEEPVMWGPAIVGFGTTQATYANGKKVDWMKVGFSPRKANLSLYLTCDLDELSDQLADLGTYSRGKGCLYIKKLSDVDQDALTELIEVALANVGE